MTILFKDDVYHKWLAVTLAEFPHMVKTSEHAKYEDIKDAWHWARDMFGQNNFTCSADGKFFFKNYDDAVMFALRCR